MSAANALSRQHNSYPSLSSSTESLSGNRTNDETPLLTRRRNMFEITERIELGKMANMFFNKTGVFLFYLCLIVYLYGDLAIYAAAVPKNFRDLICNFHNQSNVDQCWSSEVYNSQRWNSRESVYKISL